jgi:hypothetical protein
LKKTAAFIDVNQTLKKLTSSTLYTKKIPSELIENRTGNLWEVKPVKAA